MKKVSGKEVYMLRLAAKLVKNKFFWLFIFLLFSLVLINKVVLKKKYLKGIITYQVKRQNMIIAVIASGNLQALISQKIIDKVPGRRTILEVVSEGTRISEEDVKKGRVLIKLDATDLTDQAEALEINVENRLAIYTENQQNLEIQKKENQSNITHAELQVKFSRMDLERYLGEKLSSEVMSKSNFSYFKLVNNPHLAGEALNKKRQFENTIGLAKEKMARAKGTVGWSEILAKKRYITKDELEADRLSLKQDEVSLEEAKLGYKLFLNYDFPKQIEKLLSNYQESLTALETTKAKSASRLIIAEANVRSGDAIYLRYKNKLKKVEKEIAESTIRATQPGFVVYPNSGRPWRTANVIQAGTSVRQFQELIDLPNFKSMGVSAEVNETGIEKIKPGETAIIKVAAFPKKTFVGKVKKVALMPDATLKFLNPDINMYVTQISLDKSYAFLKPGMSAQVKIMVDKLENVLALPLVALFFRKGEAYADVLEGRRIVMSKLMLGESNDTLVEVKKGLKEGEIVVINPGELSARVRKKEVAVKGKFFKVKQKRK